MKKLDMLLFITLIALDQISKYVVVATMPLSFSIPLIPSFFSLTHARNYGASWSLFQNQLPFLIGVTIVALAVMLKWYSSLAKEWSFERLGLVLMLGGTIGNFIDRLVLGYVIDFIDVIIFGYDFPIFNVADIALTCGVIALILHEVKEFWYVKRT
jgi:signal peptidase II